MTGIDDAPLEVRSFEVFVAEVEPRLRRALVAGFGPVAGRDAAAEALAIAWERWEKVRGMDNPAGYLYRIGQNRARRVVQTGCWPIAAGAGKCHLPGVSLFAPASFFLQTSPCDDPSVRRSVRRIGQPSRVT